MPASIGVYMECPNNEQGRVIYKHAGPITADIVNNEILPLFEQAAIDGGIQ